MKILIFIASASILQIAFGCEHETDLKFVNETCKSDTECYNANNKVSTSCKDGRCSCNEGYVAELQWFAPGDRRLICSSAPYENAPCTTVCQKPYSCVPVDKSKPDIKTCQCHLPYIKKDGNCILECKADEVYENNVCKKRCLDDENKEDASLCKKIGKIGSKCDSANFCSTPYSECLEGICVCSRGFTANPEKDACTALHIWCPLGSPILTRLRKVRECKVVKDSGAPVDAAPIGKLIMPPWIVSNNLKDDCAHDQFCMLTSGEAYYAEGATGHCCPLPKLACPLGEPHPNATCGETAIPLFRQEPKSKEDAPFCPYTTHSCRRWSFGGSYELSLCCPIACGDREIYVKEKNLCLPVRNFGDRCEIDEQCKGHNGVCNKGRCSCPDRCATESKSDGSSTAIRKPGLGECTKEYVVEGSIGYQYCRRVCAPNEVPIGNGGCAPKLELGDKCDLLTNQCPNNAYCTEKKICDCYCGYVKLEDGSCAPQPSCPAVEGSKNPNFFYVIGLVKEFVLCRIANESKTSLTSVVDSCPRDQYCSSYTQEYGLCCPMPAKPFCPDGAEPLNECDPTASNPCGFAGYCHRYINPAKDDSSNGYVCCPLRGAHPMPVEIATTTVSP